MLASAGDLVSGRCGVVRLLARMPKDPTDPERPYLFHSELANHHFSDRRDPEEFSCSGKGMTVDAARASALGEAIERYSSSYWDPDEVVYATRAQLDEPSLDPRHLVLYLPEQYGRLPYEPYDEVSTVLGWVGARSLATGDRVSVPALSVFMTYHPQVPGEHLTSITSNGLATGSTRTRAVLAGLLEVLERDAFLISWMNRLPSERFDAATHPDDDMRELVRGYRRRGVELHLNRFPTDHPGRVFMATAAQREGDGPARVVGLGADLDTARAARKALLEVAQIVPALRIRGRRPKTIERMEAIVADPTLVADLDDHDLLYCDPRTAGAFDFLLDGPVTGEWPATESTTPERALRSLIEPFAATGTDVLYCDLTPPEMARIRLYTARVIVAEFQPIHFGYHEARLGGTRLFRLPAALGLADGPATPGSLNHDPHPLA